MRKSGEKAAARRALNMLRHAEKQRLKEVERLQRKAAAEELAEMKRKATVTEAHRVVSSLHDWPRTQRIQVLRLALQLASAK